jgi:peptidyl-prolyl cis-trans isomerase SurA
MRARTFGGVFSALALLAGTAAQAADAAAPAAQMMDGVAARVNGDSITVAEVMAEIPNSAWLGQSREQQEARLRELYGRTLDAFIDRRLILAAAKAQEMKLQGWVLNDRERELVDSRFGGDRNKLLAALTERRISYEDWRKGLEEDLLIGAMRAEFVDKRVSVSPSDIRSYYTTNRAALGTAAGVRVAIVTLTEPASGKETLAQFGDRVLKELDGGADFAAVARQYSADSRAPQGGDWGFVQPEEKFAGPIVQALAALKPGQYSRLVRLGDQAYVIRKVEEKEATTLTIEEAWPLIERRLRESQAESLYREWMARLRRGAFVQVFELPRATAAR